MTAPRTEEPPNGSGPGDGRGGIAFSKAGAIDPTKNVLDLVAAAMLRQDDLRALEVKRLNDLNTLRAEHKEVLAQIEYRHSKEVRDSESARVDALLTAQASAAMLASTRAEGTAAALAERVDTSAKTLASQVEATAKAAAVAVEATAKALDARIVPLEQFRYQLGGERGQKVDSRGSFGNVVGIIVGVGGLFIAIVTTILMVTLKK